MSQEAAKLSDQELIKNLREWYEAENRDDLIMEALARILTKLTENEWGENEIGGP